jgi:hypothetical protein
MDVTFSWQLLVEEEGSAESAGLLQRSHDIVPNHLK